ncbi:MAG: hypothetical protein F6K58_05870 [Symploca sp. SIO2E9]|nr:hypothetical protein [Symploca sp. SIO2E9]
MSNLSTINEAVKSAHDNNLTPSVVKTEGAGKAYQAVSQSMAIAVQDVTDYLRNISMLASTAVAVATEMMVANPEKVDQYSKVIEQAQSTINTAASSFEDVGLKAGNVLNKFPSGDQ